MTLLLAFENGNVLLAYSEAIRAKLSGPLKLAITKPKAQSPLEIVYSKALAMSPV